MDAELLKTVGQIAGIGGIAVGVLLLVFKEIIRKRIFPQLTKDHAYKLLRDMSFMVWSVAVIGIVAWVWMDGSPAVVGSGGVTAGRDINADDIQVTGSGQGVGGVTAGNDINAEDITVKKGGQESSSP